MWKWVIGICAPIAAMTAFLIVVSVKHKKNIQEQ